MLNNLGLNEPIATSAQRDGQLKTKQIVKDGTERPSLTTLQHPHSDQFPEHEKVFFQNISYVLCGT
jgi:hypothetical protein